MQTDQTALCPRCGARQPPANCCRRCMNTRLGDLSDWEQRRDFLRRWRERYVKSKALRLYRRAPTARRGLGAFVLGGPVTGGGVAALLSYAVVNAGGVLALDALVAGLALGGLPAVIAVGWYLLSPRTLVGLGERPALDAEVERLAAARAVPLDLLPASPPNGEVVTLHGRVAETPCPEALFGDGSAVAWRIVGRSPGGDIDDAHAISFDMVTGDAVLVHVDVSGGALVDLPCEKPAERELSASQAGFLDARGAQTEHGPVHLAWALLRPGQPLTVTGALDERAVADGYRGARTERRFTGLVHIARPAS